ncbi:hypothetical protein TIFTF001_004996 [Ficus carica]|uniref:BHLH domain-containing protein n=1 Tax=Ficus carica TaxID=3494 RepID=A0AA87ZKZ8_FICCA|nr:hypothetical protein TIFTF001_004996 [Ficus carica]
MEFIGAFPEGADWESFSRMFSSEDLEFTPHFLGQFPFPNSQNNDFEGISNLGQSSSFCPISESHTESLFHSLDFLNSNLHFLSQESSYNSTSAFSDSCHIPVTNDVSDFPDLFNGTYNDVPVFSDNVVMEEITMGNVEDDSGNRLKRMCDDASELNISDPESPPNTKKKTRVSNAQKSKKNVESSKKSQLKVAINGKEEENNDNNTGVDGHSTSSYSSEDDNASQETNGGAISDTKSLTAVNLNGKARASRGSATDPQSLYARKRRERINERLKILQNLVPNGTKVDISTMLEEAVHYVKFLQLQIKLLSSDELWMYAPLAYNGMDIGLSKKLSQLV